jgi:GDP-mannose 4,6-dehydratase
MEVKRTNILITGGTGFVGSHMIDFLLKTVPDVKIFASRRWRSRIDNIMHLFGDFRVVFIEADLTDRGSLQNLIKIAQPDYVFHFAAQSFPKSSFLTPVYTLTTNVIGTTNLLEELRLAKEYSGIDPIIVSVSSSEVYGMPKPEEVPMKESNPFRAANPYSISKVSHDLLSQYYCQAFGLKVIITRMFSHEGARRGKLFALSSFASQIVNHEFSYFNDPGNSHSDRWPVFQIKVGNLDSIRTYAHIDDAIEAYWLCATKGKIGEVYNIGGKETCTVREALEKLLEKSIVPRGAFEIVVDPDLIRPTDITLQIPDCTKFKKQTGWEPKKGLSEIVDDLLNYWRDVT